VWLPEASKVLVTLAGSEAVRWMKKRAQQRSGLKQTVYLYGPDGRRMKAIEVSTLGDVDERDDADPEKAPTKRRPQIRR
jgi:hypothetical protein